GGAQRKREHHRRDARRRAEQRGARRLQAADQGGAGGRAMIAALVELPTRRPRTFLSLALLITIVSLLLMRFRLRTETTLQGLLDPSGPAVPAMGRVLDEFAVANELLLLASVSDDTPADAAAATLLAFARRLDE